MKRIIALICMIAALVMTSASCGKHEHSFGTEWISDGEYHWHECTLDEDCDVKDNRASHEFNIKADSEREIVYSCGVCGYEKTESKNVRYGVENAAEWDRIFDGFYPKNFTMQACITVDGLEEISRGIVAEDGVFSKIAGGVDVYIAKIDETWVSYVIDNGEIFEPDVPKEDLEKAYEGYVRMHLIDIAFVGNYDKFTCNAEDGTYTSNQTLTATLYNAGGGVDCEIYCYNVVVKIVNGKVVSFSAYYNFGEESTNGYFLMYEKIGTSEVKIPQYVMDGANKAQ